MLFVWVIGSTIGKKRGQKKGKGVKPGYGTKLETFDKR